MKRIKVFILLSLLTQALSAQKPAVNEFLAIDQKALKLPDSLSKTTADISSYITSNFKTDKQRARAIFIWLATNIQYDVENMFAINFYETRENKIRKSLDSRKGICENYAALFNDICSKCGIRSF